MRTHRQQLIRKRAISDVCSSLRGQISEQDIVRLCLATEEQIAIAISAGVVVRNEQGALVRTSKPLTPEVWQEEPVQTKQEKGREEISRPLGTAPVITGLKLKNLDRAQKDQYWLLTGEERHVKAAAYYLEFFGVHTNPKPNGSTGCWMLLVPAFVRIQESTIPEEFYQCLERTA